jgi:hypothetical protein
MKIWERGERGRNRREWDRGREKEESERGGERGRGRGEERE